MKGNIIITGIEADNFFAEVAQRIKELQAENKEWIEKAYQVIPYLSKSQTATALGCSLPHVSTIVSRLPEQLKPVYKEGAKTPVYDTKQVLTLKEKGGYK